MRKLLLGLMAVGLSASAVSAAPIFSDNFDEFEGTLINGKAPDVGNTWVVSRGEGLSVFSGTLNTTGAARVAFATFTRPLQANDLMTISFNVGPTNPFSGGYAGLALFSGYSSPTSAGQERAFIGDLSGTSSAYAALGNNNTIQSTNGNLSAVLKLTYNYNTGAAEFFVDNVSYGTAAFTPAAAINALRISNDSGGDIQVDNLLVDVTTVVPEPTSLGLLGLAGVGLLRRRRA